MPNGLIVLLPREMRIFFLVAVNLPSPPSVQEALLRCVTLPVDSPTSTESGNSRSSFASFSGSDCFFCAWYDVATSNDTKIKKVVFMSILRRLFCLEHISRAPGMLDRPSRDSHAGPVCASGCGKGDSLADLSQLRTFFGIFALISFIKACV